MQKSFVRAGSNWMGPIDQTTTPPFFALPGGRESHHKRKYSMVTLKGCGVGVGLIDMKNFQSETRAYCHGAKHTSNHEGASFLHAGTYLSDGNILAIRSAILTPKKSFQFLLIKITVKITQITSNIYIMHIHFILTPYHFI